MHLVTKHFSLPQSDVGLIKTGDKVGASEATLLNMLNISPFSYGLIIQQVYDNGSVYSPEVLDITEASLHVKFLEVRCSVWFLCSWTECLEIVYELTVYNLLFSRVWGTSLACVWRLDTPLWPLSPTPLSMATRESSLSLWRPTTPSLWQTRYDAYNYSIMTLVNLQECFSVALRSAALSSPCKWH